MVNNLVGYGYKTKEVSIMSQMEKLVLGLTLITFVFYTLTRLFLRKISLSSVVVLRKATMITIMSYIVILNGVHTNCPWWFCVVMIVLLSYLGVQATQYYFTQNRWVEVTFDSETALSQFHTFINSMYAQERLVKVLDGQSKTFILNEVYYKSSAVFIVTEKSITLLAAAKYVKKFESYLNSKQTVIFPVL